jgi:hypothetical protein
MVETLSDTIILAIIITFCVAFVRAVVVLRDRRLYSWGFYLIAFFCVAAILFLPSLQIGISSFFDHGAKHFAGVFFSVLGLWLSGSSVVGKKRLEETEKRIDQDNDYIADKIRNITSMVMRPFQYWKVWLTLTITAMIILVPFYVMEQSPTIDLNFIAGTLVTGVILGLVIFIFGYFLLIVILLSLVFVIGAIGKLVMLPYRLIGLLAKEDKLERTLLFIGILLGTIGVLLLEL